MAGQVEIQEDEEYLTVDELIARWKGVFSRGHLSDMRGDGSGPPFTKFGARTVLYPVSLLLKWEADRLHFATAVKNVPR